MNLSIVVGGGGLEEEEGDLSSKNAIMETAVLGEAGTEMVDDGV